MTMDLCSLVLLELIRDTNPKTVQAQTDISCHFNNIFKHGLSLRFKEGATKIEAINKGIIEKHWLVAEPNLNVMI